MELFCDEGLALDIETDRRIDTRDVRSMDPLDKTRQMDTTSVTYESCKTNGSKVTKYVTVIGSITPDQIARIRMSCPNRQFVPNALGMPKISPDNPWAEFNPDDNITFLHTNLQPDKEITIEDLTQLFEKSAHCWRALANQF